MPAEAYEFVISGVLSGQFVQNVLHINVDNTGSSNPYTVAVDLLETLVDDVTYDELWSLATPVDYRVTSWRIRRVLAGGGPTAIKLAAELNEAVGQRTGSIQAAQVNPVLILLTTILPNRPGKVFLPGLSETDCDDMQYTAGIVTAMNNLITSMVTNFTLSTLAYAANFSVLRRASNASHDITAGRISPLIGTQRRRLRPV